MNNNDLYDYIFWSLREGLEATVKNGKRSLTVPGKNQPLLKVVDEKFSYIRFVEQISKYQFRRIMKALILKLMDNYEIEYTEDSEGFWDFSMKEGERLIGYKIVDHPEWLFDMKYIDDGEIDAVTCITLEEDNGDYVVFEPNSHKYRETTKGYVKNISLRQFFEMHGIKEYETFKGAIDKYNSEAQIAIGMHASITPSEEALNDQKEKSFYELGEFSKKPQLKCKYTETQYAVLRDDFKKNLNILFGNTKFADSFISSAWYFDTQVKTDCGLENTAIVAGYLKSVEQFLWEFIKTHIDDKIDVSVFEWKNGKSQRVDRTLTYKTKEKSVDRTLGALICYIEKSGDKLVKTDEGIKDLIVTNLKDFKKHDRNGFLHSDNIYSWEEIKTIHKKTMELYFLLLGGLKINEQQANALENKKKILAQKIELTYARFEEWLNRILSFDDLSQYNNIYFEIHKHSGNAFLDICVNDTFIDNGFGFSYKDLTDIPSMPDNFGVTKLSDISEEINDAIQEKIKQYVEKYLNEGNYAETLKQHQTIAVGSEGSLERVYQNN